MERWNCKSADQKISNNVNEFSKRQVPAFNCYYPTTLRQHWFKQEGDRGPETLIAGASVKQFEHINSLLGGWE